jgi:4-carboxymuconolactone decarboxylase
MTADMRTPRITRGTDERRPVMATEPEDTPILTLLAKMTADSLEATDLDEQTVMLVRIAALVAVDAPPASYLLNMGAAGATGVDADQVQGLLAAVAPIVGTSHVVSAVGKMMKAFDLKIELADLQLDD